MKSYSIALVPGDGIGPEVIGEAKKLIAAAGEQRGAKFEWVEYPFGAGHYLATGEILPESAIEEISACDAMLLGAIGAPGVKPGILERGILLTLRFVFDQYVNLRPAVSRPNVPSPVALQGRRINSVVVRENTEDLYMGLGAISRDGAMSEPMDLDRALYSLRGRLELTATPETPFAAQLAINTQRGIERITRYACDLARERGEKTVTLVSKSNAVPSLYGFFEETTSKVMASEYKELSCETVNVDAMCYHLVRDPARYGVVLCPNLFGDIISDMQAALAGGLGTAASGNIGDGLSMFEPVHGSAPDIAGTGRANPVAAILSGAMMLRHIGEEGGAQSIERAVDEYLTESDSSDMPFEFGGSSGCRSVGNAILRRI